MPTADYSSFHQPSGTGADGTKLDNFIDAVQATVNALDKNNLAASAGILASQLADPTTGKVLGSSGSACAAVFPPGYELDYKTRTTSITINNIAEVAATTILTSNAVTFDGAPVIVEFCAPALVYGGAGAASGLNLYLDGVDQGRVFDGSSVADVAANYPLGSLRVRLTPAAGSHTFSVRGWISSAVNLAVVGGLGGVGTPMPMFTRITKA